MPSVSLSLGGLFNLLPLNGLAILIRGRIRQASAQQNALVLSSLQ